MYEAIRNTLLFIMILALAYCSSSRNDTNQDDQGNMQSRPILGKSLAPETVQVKATLIEYKDDDRYYSGIIKLEKVLAYGPATQPLAEGSELQVEIDKDLVKNKFTSIETMLKNNHLFTMILQKNKGSIGIEVKEEQRWAVIKIE